MPEDPVGAGEGPRSRPPEQQAVRTTIVGGRPPGSGKPVGPIPRGIEVLLKKAAVDPEFRKALLERRAAAATDIGLELVPAEAAMLAAVPAAQLEAIIERTSVAPQLRAAFLGRAAAVMLAALGAGTLGCSSDDQTPPPHTKGTLPDRPPQAAPAQPGHKTASPSSAPAAAEPRPEPPPPPLPPTPPAPTGIQPDRPTTAAPADKPSVTIYKAPSDPVTRGIRPDVPPAPPAPTGIPPAPPPEEQPAAPGGSAAAKDAALVNIITLPEKWNEQTLMSTLVVRLKAWAEAILPESRFAYTQEGNVAPIRIEWRPQPYNVPRPTGKTGEKTEIRSETGPATDGLILTVWLDKEVGQAVRPQTLDNAGFWKTRLDEVYAPQLKSYLRFNVDYGAKTDKAVVLLFSSPAMWFQRVPQKAAGQSGQTQGLSTKTYPTPAGEVPNFAPPKSPDEQPRFETTGIRPDVPRGAGTFGIQPDRPPSK